MQKLFKLYKQRSIFFTFLFSYLLILIIPLLIGIMDYVHYSSIIKEESETYNLEMLQQAQSVLDERLKNVEQLSMDISANLAIQNYLLNQKDSKNDDLQMMLDVANEIKKNVGLNDYVSDIYIYFAKSDVILTGSAKYTPEFYFQTYYQNSGLSFEEWKQTLTEKRFLEYSLLDKNKKLTDGNTIKLLRSLRIGSGNVNPGTLVIAFKSDMLQDVLDKMDVLGNSSAFIINRNNQIVTSSGNLGLSLADKYDDLKSENYNHYTKISGKDVVINGISSKMNDWVYVSVKPMDILMQKANSTRNITFIIVMTGLMIGILLALILSRKNVTPIKQLVGLLKDNTTESNIIDNTKNEIDFIKNATMAALKETKTAKAAMKDQLPTIQASTLVQLLKGNILDTVNLDHVLNSIGISFTEQDFCVLIIDIESCDDEALRKEWSLIKFIISNVMSELGNEKNNAFMLDLEWERMALLINLKEDAKSFDVTVNDISVKVRDFMFERYSTSISIGIGGIQRGIENVKESYRDAKKALEYKMLKGRRSICLSSDLAIDHQSYDYSIETEMQLIKSVKYGDFDTVRALLKEIFEYNFKGKNLSMDMARCFYFDIMSTGIKVLNSINIEYSELFGVGINPLDRLTSCNTTGEMHETLEYIYQKICGYISSIQVEPENEEIVKQVMEYIERNFSDPNLSLSMVAEDFKLSPSYLSHIFKEHTNNNFVNWLREKRIEKVCELLTESEMSLEQIAQVTGYVNSNVLIRNFKKIENITPGLYREINGKLKLISSK